MALRERALALDPVSRGGHHNLGSALLNAGRPEESQAMFRRALDIAPDTPLMIADRRAIDLADRVVELRRSYYLTDGYSYDIQLR